MNMYKMMKMTTFLFPFFHCSLTRSSPSSTTIATIRRRRMAIQQQQQHGTPAAFTPSFFPSSSFLSTSTTSLSSTTDRRTIQEGALYSSEQVIKKSRFIGIATKCDNWKDAQFYLDAIKEEHPKARHVCFGFVAGVDEMPGGVVERCSDDGEPTGTGGLPILGGIKGEGLSDTLCAVVRYSGGIKLGAGGLIRAYGGTARLVLRDAPTEILIPKSTIRLSTSSSNAGCIYDAARKFNAVTSDENYSADGKLEISMVCESSFLEDMMETMKDSTRGDVTFLD